MTNKDSKDTRSIILESIQTRLQTNGFTGFTLEDVAKDANIKKASIYYYFPSKSDATAEALTQICHKLDVYLRERDDEGCVAQYDAYVQFLRDKLDNGNKALPTVTFAGGEWFGLPENIRKALRYCVDFHYNWILSMLVRADERKLLKIEENGGTIQDIAYFVFSSLQGAAMAANFFQNIEIFNKSATCLKEKLFKFSPES